MQDAPKPAIKKPARQQQTTGTQTAAQDAPHAPLMPQQGEVPGATAKAPAAPADQDVPAPIPAQRKTAFMDIKVDVNLAQEADKPDGDASLKAAEYEQALRKAQVRMGLQHQCDNIACVGQHVLTSPVKAYQLFAVQSYVLHWQVDLPWCEDRPAGAWILHTVNHAHNMLRRCAGVPAHGGCG